MKPLVQGTSVKLQVKLCSHSLKVARDHGKKGCQYGKWCKADDVSDH